MPLQGEVYVIENNPSTYIIHLERRKGSNDHPGVGFRETKLKNLIVGMESEAGHWDALQGTWTLMHCSGLLSELSWITVTNTQTYHSDNSSLPRASCHGFQRFY